MSIVDSNHGSLVYRRGKFAGLPRHVIRPWEDIINAPRGHTWHNDLFVKMSNGQDLYVAHQIGANILAAAQRKSVSCIQGHYHQKFCCDYWNNGKEVRFAVTGGCLLDQSSLAFNYARINVLKSMLGAVVIIEGVPVMIPMLLDAKGRWNGAV